MEFYPVTMDILRGVGGGDLPCQNIMRLFHLYRFENHYKIVTSNQKTEEKNIKQTRSL